MNDPGTTSEPSPTGVGSFTYRARWAAIIIVVLAVLGFAGWTALGQPLRDTPKSAIETFIDAYLASDVSGMQKRVTPALGAALGDKLRETIPRGTTVDFVVVTEGETATAKQSTLDWDLSLRLVKQGEWRVDEITVVRKAVGTASFTGERVVRVAQLPEDERIELTRGTAGTRAVIDATTFVNGVKTGTRTLEGEVIDPGAPSLVLLGTGRPGPDDNIRLFFDDARFTVRHTITAAPGAKAAGAVIEAGDRLTYFMITPSGEIAEAPPVTWDGSWDAASTSSGPRTHTFDREWTIADLAGAGVGSAAYTEWPAGRYVLGVTRNDGVPIGWSSYVVP